jgi:hypothetical protein
MNDDPFATAAGVPEEITAILRQANQQLETANLQMAWIEEGQTKLIGYLHHLLDLVGKLEIEKNTWKFRAGEIERECNIWQSKAEDLGSKLHAARQLNAKLGIQTGEARCPECGSADIALLHGVYSTGVVAPDGGKEFWYEAAWDCQECGHKEEMAP